MNAKQLGRAKLTPTTPKTRPGKSYTFLLLISAFIVPKKDKTKQKLKKTNPKRNPNKKINKKNMATFTRK